MGNKNSHVSPTTNKKKQTNKQTSYFDVNEHLIRSHTYLRYPNNNDRFEDRVINLMTDAVELENKSLWREAGNKCNDIIELCKRHGLPFIYYCDLYIQAIIYYERGEVDINYQPLIEEYLTRLLMHRCPNATVQDKTKLVVEAIGYFTHHAHYLSALYGCQAWQDIVGCNQTTIDIDLFHAGCLAMLDKYVEAGRKFESILNKLQQYKPESDIPDLGYEIIHGAMNCYIASKDCDEIVQASKRFNKVLDDNNFQHTDKLKLLCKLCLDCEGNLDSQIRTRILNDKSICCLHSLPISCHICVRALGWNGYLWYIINKDTENPTCVWYNKTFNKSSINSTSIHGILKRVADEMKN